MSTSTPAFAAAPARVTAPAFACIVATAFIDNLAFSMTLPVMPLLIQEVSGSTLAEAAVVGGWLLCAFAALQVVATPVLGRLSDAFGRRPVLLLSLLALGADFLVIALARDEAWLFAARVVSGLLCATVPTVFAYVSDLTPPRERAARFGRLGAAASTSMMLGPALGGALALWDVRAPFAVAATLAVANALFGLLVLPESLQTESRVPLGRRVERPSGVSIASLLRDPVARAVLFAMLMFAAAHQTMPAVWAYFTADRFQWTAQQVGWSIAAAALGMVVVQTVLVGRIGQAFGEPAAALAGLLAMAVAMVGFAFALNSVTLVLLLLPYALGSLAMPALRSLLSMHAGAQHQGLLHGVAGSVHSAAAIAAPLGMAQLFAVFSGPAASHSFAGAPFVVGAGMLLTGCGVLACCMRGTPSRLAGDRHA